MSKKRTDNVKKSHVKTRARSTVEIPKEGVVRPVKPKTFPRSYRLDPEVIQVLNRTLDRMNKVNPKRISEARLIKALIMLSGEMDEEKLTKALKEVW